MGRWDFDFKDLRKLWNFRKPLKWLQLTASTQQANKKTNFDSCARKLQKINCITRNLKVDGYQSNVNVMLKQFLLFCKFYDVFCGPNSFMNRPCFNNLFQIMQYDNFRNLNSVIFTQWKHLETRVDAFWYYFKEIKWYTFHYLKKRFQFQEIRALLKHWNFLVNCVIKV